jgi:hypothetical protein
MRLSWIDKLFAAISFSRHGGIKEIKTVQNQWWLLGKTYYDIIEDDRSSNKS